MTAKSFPSRHLVLPLLATCLTLALLTPRRVQAQELVSERNLYTSLSLATTVMISLAYLVHDLSEDETETMFFSTTCSFEMMELTTSTSSQQIAAANLYLRLHSTQIAEDVALGQGPHLKELLQTLHLQHALEEEHFLEVHLAGHRRPLLLQVLLHDERPDLQHFLSLLLFSHSN